MARVDVVIPCYKYAHFLRECVQSVLTQDGVDVRVLIIDDCSPDNTEEVGRQLAAEDSRVEFRRHTVNRRHIATYNEGLLEWASGDYCLLLSADDLSVPGALARAARLMDRHPNVSVTYGKAIRTDRPAPNSAPAAGDAPCEVIPGIEYIRHVCRTGSNAVETPTAVVRTAVQRRAGGYRPELPHAGDMEMWLRLAAHGDVGRIDAYQAVYRLHGQNMSNAYYAGTGDIEQCRDVFDSFFKHCHQLVPGWQELRDLAMHSTAMAAFWSADKCFQRRDKFACRQLLNLAAELSPRVRKSSEWRKFAVRRLVGPTASAGVRSLLSLVRGWQ
jgi:glycosyltransferase involved in cell wall biosynthesis